MSKKTADSKPWDKRYPICEVRWVDSCGHGGWREAKESIRENRPGVALSVGYLLEHSAERILVAQSLDDSGNTNDRMDIPQVAIVKVRYLARPKSGKPRGKKK